MTKNSKLLLYVAPVFLLLWGMVWWGGGERQKELAQHCSARWQGSGYAAKYDKVAKCRVRVAGRWAPEANVKVGP